MAPSSILLALLLVVIILLAVPDGAAFSVPNNSGARLGFTSAHAPLFSISSNAPHDAVPWLIVGGGIHGVAIASRLLSSGAVSSASSILIVDPNPSLLHSWKLRTSATGMRYLRSSAGYHLDAEVDSLSRFGAPCSGKRRRLESCCSSAPSPSRGRGAKKGGVRAPEGSFAKDYKRPSLDLFNSHCDSVISKYSLEGSLLNGEVCEITPNDKDVRVLVAGAEGAEERVYVASTVVLALGNSGLEYPDWVSASDLESGAVRHLLDLSRSAAGFDEGPRPGSDVAIVGGGITAAHKALELSRAGGGNRTVHLVSRHELREQQFDTHQDYMVSAFAALCSSSLGGEGVPERQRAFSSTKSMSQRREIICRERASGTVSASVGRGRGGLRYAIEEGEVEWHLGGVERCEATVGGGRRLTLTGGEQIEVGEVLLATGFEKRRPGGRLVDDLVERVGLKVSEGCGYPVVDEGLRWHPRLLVAGGLAELEVRGTKINMTAFRLAR